MTDKLVPLSSPGIEQAREPIGDLVDIKAFLKRKPTGLCDPECEGRCRVCPLDYVEELLAALATVNAQAKSLLAVQQHAKEEISRAATTRESSEPLTHAAESEPRPNSAGARKALLDQIKEWAEGGVSFHRVLDDLNDYAAAIRREAQIGSSVQQQQAKATEPWMIRRLQQLHTNYRFEANNHRLGSFKQSEALAFAVSLEHALTSLSCDEGVIRREQEVQENQSRSDQSGRSTADLRDGDRGNS